MFQYLFFCDSDDGRFSFLKLMAKYFSLRLDTSVVESFDGEQDVYRFSALVNNHLVSIIHPLSSIDGLKNIQIDAEHVSKRAFILINMGKRSDEILKNLIQTAK